MPFDLAITPSILLSMWAGGLAFAAGVVARWRIVGPGYLWTAGASVLLIGAAAVGAGPWAAAAAAAVVLAMILARHPAPAGALLLAAGASFMIHGLLGSPEHPFLVLTGALALGGTTSEMLLGHWYLIDPKLPRWALRRLDAAGIAGLVLDTGYVVVLGGLDPAGGMLRWAFLGLAVTSVAMMTAVWFTLREKGYEGVMAATGLSYLSVLTAIGSVAVGRFLLA